jgi:hypothetical protein
LANNTNNTNDTVKDNQYFVYDGSDYEKKEDEGYLAEEKKGEGTIVRKGMFHEQSKIKRSSESSRMMQMCIMAIAIIALLYFLK